MTILASAKQSDLNFPTISPAHILESSARIVMISDTHGKHKNLLKIPDGDVLIHSGDCCGKETTGHDPTLRQAGTSLINFLEWFGSFSHPVKILVGGNHDFPFTGYDFISKKAFARDKQAAIQWCRNQGVLYLEDQGCLVDRLRIYGTPWQPEFKDMAFNLKDSERQKVFDSIPETDILITHIPPYGVLDLDHNNQHCGCNLLKANLPRIGPKLHTFGHIHEAAGMEENEGCTFVNASSVNRDWNIVNQPVVVDINV